MAITAPIYPTVNSTKSALNITADTLVKAGSGRVVRISVVVASSTFGAVNDSATVGGATAANTLAIITKEVGIYDIDFPVTAGLVVQVGTGATYAVSYI